MKLPRTAYISGPMTGKPNFNREAFEEARDHLVSLGVAALVPGDGEIYTESETKNLAADLDKRHWYMRKDFAMLSTVEAIVMLPGWQKSQGAKAELLVAQEMGLQVWRYHTEEKAPGMGYSPPGLQALENETVATIVRKG